MKPGTRVKLGLRAALRRRYGYAALRLFRLALLSALQALLSAPDAPRGPELAAVLRLYQSGLRRLRRRWPTLDANDYRSRPY